MLVSLGMTLFVLAVVVKVERRMNRSDNRP
jgi:hypothetical protein